jgi:hypothetical protein
MTGYIRKLNDVSLCEFNLNCKTCFHVSGENIKVGSLSSSARSDSSGEPIGRVGGTSSGNETEEGEVKARHLLLSSREEHHHQHIPKVWVKLCQSKHSRHEKSCRIESQQSTDDEDEEDDEDDEDDEDVESNSSAFSGEGDTSLGLSKSTAVQGVANNLKMHILSGQKQRLQTRPGVPLVATQRRSMRVRHPVVIKHRGISSQSLSYVGNPSPAEGQCDSDEEKRERSVEQGEAVGHHLKIVHPPKVLDDECEGEGLETDDDDNEENIDDGGDEDESSEYSSSPDSAHNCSQLACVKTTRRRRDNSTASEDDSMPKCKRLKSQSDLVIRKASHRAADGKIGVYKEYEPPSGCQLNSKNVDQFNAPAISQVSLKT